jgi:hypothetical protein
MLTVQSVGRRSWLHVGWLVLLALGALVTALNIYVGLLFTLLVAIGGAALVAPSRLPRLWPAGRARRARRVALAPSPRRIVYTADGNDQVAFVVPVQGAEGYQAVLTSEGYKLVNSNGEIVYTLGR